MPSHRTIGQEYFEVLGTPDRWLYVPVVCPIMDAVFSHTVHLHGKGAHRLALETIYRYQRNGHNPAAMARFYRVTPPG
jgi:hypothetical protein